MNRMPATTRRCDVHGCTWESFSRDAHVDVDELLVEHLVHEHVPREVAEALVSRQALERPRPPVAADTMPDEAPERPKQRRAPRPGRRTKTAGEHGQHIPHASSFAWRVLEYVRRHGPVGLVQIAEALGTARNSTSATLTMLKRRGLVEQPMYGAWKVRERTA